MCWWPYPLLLRSLRLIGIYSLVIWYQSSTYLEPLAILCTWLYKSFLFHWVIFSFPHLTFFLFIRSFGRPYNYHTFLIHGSIDHWDKGDPTTSDKQVYSGTFSTSQLMCRQSYTDKHVTRQYSRYFLLHTSYKVGIFCNFEKHTLK